MKTKTLGYEIWSGIPPIDFNRKTVISTINPHSYCVAKRDVGFRKALLDSTYLISDGVGIVWAAKILTSNNLIRVTGSDIHSEVLKIANLNGLRVFYLGSTTEVLDKIETRISTEYPNVVVKSLSPPFKETFSTSESSSIVESINMFNPDILFVGMTAPKQEKWVHENKSIINSNLICSIGAVFDFYSGNVKRSPIFLQKLGLEWLHRSIISPKRLGKRNLTSNPDFIIDVIKEKFKIR